MVDRLSASMSKRFGIVLDSEGEVIGRKADQKADQNNIIVSLFVF